MIIIFFGGKLVTRDFLLFFFFFLSLPLFLPSLHFTSLFFISCLLSRLSSLQPTLITTLVAHFSSYHSLVETKTLLCAPNFPFPSNPSLQEARDIFTKISRYFEVQCTQQH